MVKINADTLVNATMPAIKQFADAMIEHGLKPNGEWDKSKHVEAYELALGGFYRELGNILRDHGVEIVE